MNEISVRPPSLLPRGWQGSPGLFPPPFCQGLLFNETFKPALPTPADHSMNPHGKLGPVQPPVP